MVSARSSVFIFIGSDTYLKDNAAREISSAVLEKSSRELDLKLFCGPQSNAREILEYASTIPFLASRRLVIVKEFEKLSGDDRKRIIECAKNPAKTTCLILDSKDESILEEFGKIPQHVSVRTFAALKGQDLVSWIRQFCSSRGKKIENEAIEFLKESGTENLSQLSQELDKIIAFSGTRDTITALDVEEVSGRALVASAFDLTDAIGTGRADDALRVVNELLTLGKKHYEVIGLLSWHVKRLLKAKTLRLKGATDAYIANALRINRKYFHKFFEQAKRLRMETIRSQMRILLEADLDIKRSSLDAVLVLECAIIRLCLG